MMNDAPVRATTPATDRQVAFAERGTGAAGLVERSDARLLGTAGQIASQQTNRYGTSGCLPAVTQAAATDTGGAPPN